MGTDSSIKKYASIYTIIIVSHYTRKVHKNTDLPESMEKPYCTGKSMRGMETAIKQASPTTTSNATTHSSCIYSNAYMKIHNNMKHLPITSSCKVLHLRQLRISN